MEAITTTTVINGRFYARFMCNDIIIEHVHGPMVWNSLPDDLRAQQDYVPFKQGLNRAWA